MTPAQLRRLAVTEHLLFAAYLAVLADQCRPAPLLTRAQALAALREQARALGVDNDSNSN